MHEFLGAAITEMLEDGFGVEFHAKEFLTPRHRRCLGYFSHDPPLIECATQRSTEEWLSVFTHEFCHYIQWKEGFGSDKIDNAYITLSEWKDGNTPTDKFKRACSTAREFEADCERRTVELMKIWELPIDLKKYVVDANLYCLSYSIYSLVGKWPPKKLSSIEGLVKLVPNNKILDSFRLPKGFKKIALAKAF